MRKLVVLFVFVALLLVATSIFLTGSLFVVQRLAGVHDPQGTVELKRADSPNWRPIADVKTVKTGDTLRTGGDGSVELSWVDGTRMVLAENTELVVRKCIYSTSKKASESLFTLKLGRIWIRLIRALTPGSRFEVATPTSVAGVRGTVFSVAVDLDGRSEISVYDGEVSVDTGDRSYGVPAGQKLACDSRQSSDLARLTESELQAWSHQEQIVAPFLDITKVTFSPPAASGPRQATLDIESEPGAQVQAGDARVTLDDRGRAEAVVTVPPNADTLTVTARDARGAETVRQVPLESAPAQPTAE